MTFSLPARWLRWLEMTGVALIAAAIVHLAATLIAPSLSQGDAYQRLARGLPVNRFVLLPAAKPGTQVIPYQSAAHKLSICRFDTTDGPVAVSAVLPEAGWTFSVYGRSGDGLFTLTGQQERRTDASVILMPTGDRFVGSPVVQQPGRPDPTTVAAGAEGLVVLSAPIKGRGTETEIDRTIATATCRQLKY